MSAPNPTRGYLRVFDGNSRIQSVSSMTTFGVAPIFSMKLSPDGNFLATGDEDGVLEVYVRGAASTWKQICLYTTGAAIWALVWHPLAVATIFLGSANRTINKITIVLGGNNIRCDALVPGYIHLLQLSPDGQKLVISHGHTISVVDNPFSQLNRLGTLVNFDIPVLDNVQTFSDHYIPRGIFFLPGDDSTVLIAFLGRRGIQAYSIVDRAVLWSIPLRENTFLGSAAISPSGERIAVMNLRDGIDFYSTSCRQFISTTKYAMSTQDPPQNLIVDILFVDDDTVAFGHSDGFIAFATFGIDRPGTHFEIDNNHSVPVRTITFGFVEDTPMLFGLSTNLDTARSERLPSDIHIGKIETPSLILNSLGRYNVRVHPPNVSKLSKVTVVWIIVFSVLGTLIGQSMIRSNSATPVPPSGRTHMANLDPPKLINPTATSSSLDLSPSFYVCTVTGAVKSGRKDGNQIKL